MKVAGIDGGSGLHKVYIEVAGSPQPVRDSRGCAAIASAIFRQEDGSWLVGHDALQMSRVFPDRGIRDFKRHLGTSQDLGLGLTARGATSIILREIKKMIDDASCEEVGGVVLLKPAVFDDAQTADLLAAASDAGVPVLGVLTEPCAAILSIIDGRPLPPGKRRVLCLDAGCGTFDMALVEVDGSEVRVLAADGVVVGGEDLTRVLSTQVSDAAAAYARRPIDFAALTGQPAGQLAFDLEQAKMQLSVQASALVPVPVGGAMRAIKVLRNDFENACRPVLEPAVDCVRRLMDAQDVSPKDLDLVIYTGAPMRSVFIRELFDTELCLTGQCAPEPSLAAAAGAHLHAKRLAHEAGHRVVGYLPSSASVTDCTTQNIGVMLVHFEGNQRLLRCHVLVNKGQPVPATLSELFRPEIPNQTTIEGIFVQGTEGAPLEECTVIGRAVVPLVPEPTMRERIRVTVQLRNTSMTLVSVCDEVSGRTETVTLEPLDEQRQLESKGVRW